MPGSAGQTSGMALTQWLAVTTTPGFFTSPSAIVSGCRPLNVRLTVGSPVISTSKRSPRSPKFQAGSRFSSPVGQRLPAEPARGHGARADRERAVVDIGGRDRDVLDRPDVRLDTKTHVVGGHSRCHLEPVLLRAGHRPRGGRLG